MSTLSEDAQDVRKRALVERVAQGMADRIGHGMREKCIAAATVAVEVMGEMAQLHREQIRVAVVSAVREVTGCPDLKGKDGRYLTDILMQSLTPTKCTCPAGKMPFGRCCKAVSAGPSSTACDDQLTEARP